MLLILMLEAEGKLSLEDEVQTHLPYVARLAYPVTLRQLASNTSGSPYRRHLFRRRRASADLAGVRPLPTGRSPDIFEILVKDGVPTFLDSSGVSAFDFGHQGGAKPERRFTDLILSPRPDGKIDGTFCGTPRIYAPLGADAKAATPLAARYANKAQSLEVEIDGHAQRGMFRLRSDLGAMSAPIAAADSDLWFLLQPDTDLPWMSTLSVTADGFVMNSDRIKKLRFTRA